MLNSVASFANCIVKFSDESIGTTIAHEFNRLGYEIVDERYEDKDVKYVVKSDISEWGTYADDLFRYRGFVRTRSYSIHENYVTSIGSVMKEEIYRATVKEKNNGDPDGFENKLQEKFLKNIKNVIKKCPVNHHR